MAESSDKPTILTVTFGRSSFVGRALVVALLSSGRFAVRVVDPLPAPDPTPSLSPFFLDGRLSYHQVDICHRSASLSAAFAGAAVAFHVDPTAAALHPPPLPSSDFHRLHLILAQSTRNVILACRECGVERLVYVGSADVVVGDANEVCSWDETVAYPERFVDRLSELRAQAEAMVLRANISDGFSTCALRVSNPFGPGDDILLPSLLQGAKEGWSKFIIGSGENLWDFTYIENVVHASISAEQALRLRTPYVAGRPFFITNQEPVKFWDFLSSILEGLGYQRPSINLPAKVALTLVEVASFFPEKLLCCKISNPFVSPSSLRSFTGTRTYDCSNAERVLGYSPIVSIEDGLTLTIASFQQLANGSYIEQQDLVKPSKAEKLLGSGSVAEILLWRDDRKTFTCMLALFMLHYWFCMCERTFISSAAKLLLLFAVILFVHGTLPFSMLGFPIERVPLSSFEVPEFILRKFFCSVASLWNLSIHVLDTVAQGEDWGFLFKLTGFLCFTKLLLLLFSFSLLSAAGLVCLFTFFMVYEQCEGEIEKLIACGTLGLSKMKSLLIVNLPSSMVKYFS